MLELKNVVKIYNDKKRAVNDLSLSIKKGEIFGFLGPNSLSKTEIMCMILYT